MKAGIKTQSTILPPNISMKWLFDGLYELEANCNVTTITVGEEQTTQYEYNHFSEQAKLKSYDEAVSALVGLKYSTGDEIALMRKGISEPTATEYTEYISYVQECKVYARKNTPL